MKLKICGMKHADNIAAILPLQPDYMGFIFYAKSKRFVGENFNKESIESIPSNVQKVGVFVNSDFDYITSKIDQFGLQCVQLHGSETPDLCRKLQRENTTVIKVFSVGDDFDFGKLKDYEDCCDYFLFDTKGKEYGGNGTTFNWQVLENYPSSKPFFLSGGIGLEELPKLLQLKHLNIHAIDVNSRFEIRPAEKDVEKLKQLTEKLNTKKN